MGTKAAEKALEAAERAVEDAETRLASVEKEVRERREEAEAADAAIREAHASGDGIEGVRELRKKRREARTEAEDLEAEVSALEDLVTRRERERDEAAAELALARVADIRSEARELATDLRDHLDAVTEATEKLQALDKAWHRNVATAKSRSAKAISQGPDPATAAGIHSALFAGLRSLVADYRKNESRRPLIAESFGT